MSGFYSSRDNSRRDFSNAYCTGAIVVPGTDRRLNTRVKSFNHHVECHFQHTSLVQGLRKNSWQWKRESPVCVGQPSQIHGLHGHFQSGPHTSCHQSSRPALCGTDDQTGLRPVSTNYTSWFWHMLCFRMECCRFETRHRSTIFLHSRLVEC